MSSSALSFPTSLVVSFYHFSQINYSFFLPSSGRGKNRPVAVRDEERMKIKAAKIREAWSKEDVQHAAVSQSVSLLDLTV